VLRPKRKSDFCKTNVGRVGTFERKVVSAETITEVRNTKKETVSLKPDLRTTRDTIQKGVSFGGSGSRHAFKCIQGKGGGGVIGKTSKPIPANYKMR